MKSTEPNVKTFTQVCDGDLYRFFYTDKGELIAIRFFPLMHTVYHDVSWADVPAEVRSKFEDHFCK